jgi:uncharacterized coiled-coil protein SlyX
LVIGVLATTPNAVSVVEAQCSVETKSITGSGAVEPATVEETKTCSPPGLGALLPYVFIALVFLLPDLAELEVPGLVSLKRRVEEQEEKVDRQERRVDSLISTIVANQNISRQDVSVHLNEISERIREKQAELAGRLGDRADDGVPVRPDVRAQLVESVIELSNQLSEARSRSDRTDEAGPDLRHLRRWAQLYRNEIQALIAEADTVASNAFALDMNDLETLEQAMRSLLYVARG